MENELFEKAPIPTAYLKLAIPVVLSMVVQLVYNMVDTYFIALTGNTSLIAGVSICTPLFTLKGLPAFILSLCRQGVVYAFTIAVLSSLFGYYGVISSQLGADIISVIIAFILFRIYISPELKKD